jgi:predicted ATPase/DNA-binding winged helix-turn-helix (wHTH) protein
VVRPSNEDRKPGGKLLASSEPAMGRDIASLKQAKAFGPFRLFVAERLLEKADIPIALGSRSLDILILLVERAGNVVTKEDLISRVWPNRTVDENSLRVHVASLRKVLGDGQAGHRYVTNISGRGYCFVAPIVDTTEPKVTSNPEPVIVGQAHRLPLHLAKMVGRDETVRTISELLAAKRFVTIHGPGGIGKTTVAVSVGHAQLAVFNGAVRFADLGPLKDPRHVAGAVASTLQIPIQSNDPSADIISFLRDRRMLLILDNCEHVVEAAASLGERIFLDAPQVGILATSREALRAEGEQVYQLSPLESPPEGVELTAAQVLAFSATHLFVERASAGGNQFELTDQDATTVAEICRKLDGIALAIELVARRVSVHGLRETALLLDNRLRLLWSGRRTAQPRHRTLRATVDWSHDLLTSIEQTVFRRISIFVGSFNLEAAQSAAASDELDGLQIVSAVEHLVAKSLVFADARWPTMRYRMLDATRAFASEKLVESGEQDPTARQHAVYFRALLERIDAGGDKAFAYEEHLGNVRAALEWSFQDRGDATLGIALAAASTRLFLELSLLSECRRWAERALSVLGDAECGTQHEMELQAALGLSLLFTTGNSKQAYDALSRGMELAENSPDRVKRFRIISRLHMYYRRSGDTERMLDFALRAKALAEEMADPGGIAAANSMVGVSHHLIGDQRTARVHLEAALARPSIANPTKTADFGFHRERAQIALARTLWLLGFPDQAMGLAGTTSSEPATTDPVSLCIVLIWGFCVFRWAGDWPSGEACIERLIPHADRHALTPYRAIGVGFRGEMLMKRGEVVAGMDLLRSSMEIIRADRYGLYATEFNSLLAQGFAMRGHLDEALATIDETIARVKRKSDLSMPELLRIRGEFLEQSGNEREAEDCFLRSSETADQQSALSWRLRASTNLARLRLRQGRWEEGRKPLADAYASFGEGFNTVDLKAAKRTLEEIDGRMHRRKPS